ncbi:MAG TPA: tRNA pseudouridine(55) synthase TruB [Gemmatimonadales bacterium]|nr:tRNA pseudouridine(55) synthase TruB [Gemmatimonadales bacterium]
MNGALLVDKPAGVTSHDVVAIVRRALTQQGGPTRPAVGHTGTLDPFATGLLVVLVGKATRLARFLDGSAKEYEATIRLGQGSDTDDATGTLGSRVEGGRCSEAEVRKALAGLVGTQMQMPPAFSAKKIDGERAYARARKGEEVVLKAVEVTIHSAELLRYEWPDAEVRVVVSTGTYIRSLARDLGARLGTAAHCAALRRTRIGRFEVAGAQSLESIQSAGAQGRSGAALIPMAEVVGHLPTQELDAGEVAFIKNGRKVATEHEGGPIALLHQGELLAIAEVAEGMAQPVVVLVE